MHERTLGLTYDEALDTGSVPATSTFTVTVGGTSRAVSEVSVEGDSVKLILASAATSSDAVSVGYAAPADSGDARLRDAWGTPADSFDGEAAAWSGTPGAPRSLSVFLPDDGQLRVSWDEPSFDGGSAVSEYRVEWKSGDQEYDASRSAAVTGLSHRIAGLTNGLEYTVRVTAVNPNGDGVPAEVVGVPLSDLNRLRAFMERDIVEEYEGSHPWLRATWNHMNKEGFTLTTSSGDSASVGLECSGEIDLEKCSAVRMQVGDRNIYNESVLLHEMAHVFTMTNGLGAAAPLGIAHLYLDSKDFQSARCSTAEIYADLLALSVSDTANVTYWERCNQDYQSGESDSLTGNALAVVRSALSGVLPQWFADYYNDSEANPDLERVWEDVKLLDEEATYLVAYRLRDEFGGYCDGPKVADALDSDGSDIRNPWRDGGCVPEAPDGLGAVAREAALELSWNAPNYDGGASIEGYRVEWKSEGGGYGPSRRVVVHDLPNLSVDITGLSNGVEYTLRVSAVNAFGAGAFSDEITTTPRQNIPATGLPDISGTAQVDETLTVDTSGIEDADGLTNVSYSYQWVVNDGTADADILDASSSSYTPSTSDVGKTIKVRVSFTDDADYAESLTSAASDTVAATKPDVPGHLNVSVHDTGALDVYWEAPATDGGSSITGYKVQWKESADSWDTPTDVSEETVSGTTHTITGLADGTEYTVRVLAVNDVGEGPPSAEASRTPQEEPIWSATVTVGTAEKFAGYSTFLPDSNVLGALSSDTITLDDTSYTVKALGVLDGTLILTVTPKMTAGFVLATGTAEFASTDATTQEGDTIIQFRWSEPGLDWSEGEEVAVRLTKPDDNTPATGTPTVNGTAQVGETLTADTSAISDEDGLTNVSYRYQWIAGESDIDGATRSTYTLKATDQGKTVRVRVSFTDDADNSESLSSAATAAVDAKPDSTIPETPLTVSLESAATTHNGTNAFTFEIRFSEEFGISYVTLRDHAFTVTDGKVIKARRLTKGSNIGWRISVRPDSNEEVTVVLPVTGDCDGQAAICTDDGRMLSNSLNFTVPAPSG